jgi:hypothetical protein
VSNDPGQQIVLYLEYSQRRLSETNTLVDESRYTDANQTLDEFQEQVRSAVASLDSVKDTDTVHKELLAMTIQEKLSDHNKQLNTLLPKVPPGTKMAVSQAMMVSNDGVAVAQTAIKRLSTMHTPQPGDGLTAQPGSTTVPTEIQQIVPTEEQFLLPLVTPTDEFRQIFSSTVAPTVPGSGVLPTYSLVGPTVAPIKPTSGIPTAVPTDVIRTRPPRPSATPLPPPTSTPMPENPTAEPTLSGVTTATPAPPPTQVVDTSTPAPVQSSSDTPVP